MRFAFRADGSSIIGFGHLSRTAALASAAQRAGAEVVFVLAASDAAGEAFVRHAGFEVRRLDATAGSHEDADATRQIAGPCSYIVVDGYAFSANWLSGLDAQQQVVVYVDDLAREPFDVDVVVNPNVCGSRATYEVASKTLLLAGPKYAIVHDQFVAARTRKIQRPGRAERLLITMGGSDPPGATLRALEELASVPVDLEVRVIVGAANPRLTAIAAAVAECPSHNVELRTCVEDMAEEMVWADVALTASGVTSTELACVGVPGISFAIVDNQRPIAAELAYRGMFDVLEFGGGSAGAIARAIDRIVVDAERRTAQVEAQRNVIDGAGKDRVVQRLLALGRDERHNPPDGDDLG